jgi:hypothetical protein
MTACVGRLQAVETMVFTRVVWQKMLFRLLTRAGEIAEYNLPSLMPPK